MSNELLLSPPIVFLMIMLTAIFVMYLLSKLALKPKKVSEGLTKEYSCGEEIKTHMIQPDYSQFVPFPFYFTILHVAALMIATVPMATLETFFIAIVIYSAQ